MRNAKTTSADEHIHPWPLNPVMVRRRCKRVVRRYIYSPLSCNGSILRPLCLVLAKPSRPRSVIIAPKVVRSDRPRRRRSSLVFFSSSSSSSSSQAFASRRERRTVTSWPGSSVCRDLGWVSSVFVDVRVCKRHEGAEGGW